MQKFKIGDLISWRHDKNYLGLIVECDAYEAKVIFLKWGSLNPQKMGISHTDTLSFFEQHYDKI